MKKIALTIIAVIAVSLSGYGQLIKLGIKGGALFPSDKLFNSQVVSSDLKASDVGFTAGLVARITVPVAGIFVQPELNYSYSRYILRNENGEVSKIGHNNLELPVMLGIKLLFLKINAGPVFNIANLGGSKNNYNITKPRVGYQAGAGLALGKFDIDIRYHGYFSKAKKQFSFPAIKDDIKVNKGLWSIALVYYL